MLAPFDCNFKKSNIALFAGSTVHLSYSCNERYLQIHVNSVSSKDFSQAKVDSNLVSSNSELLIDAAEASPDGPGISETAATQDQTLAVETNHSKQVLKEVTSVEVDIVNTLSVQKNCNPSSKSSIEQIEDVALPQKGGRKTCITANRRKVARLNDEQYLEVYQKAISSAIQTLESASCNGGIDVLCLCGEMSIIPLVIPQKGK